MYFRGIFMAVLTSVYLTSFASDFKPPLSNNSPPNAPPFCNFQSGGFSPTVLHHFKKNSSSHRFTEKLQKNGSVLIEADNIRSDGQGVWFIDGHVHIKNEHNGIFAERAEYNEATRIARFFGNVLLYTKDGHPLMAKKMKIHIDMFKGEMTDDAQIHLVERSLSIPEQNQSLAQFNNPYLSDSGYQILAKVTAQTIEINGESDQVIYNATLTTCPGKDPDIKLTASEMKLDHSRGQGRAENMVIRFKNVPIFYFKRVYFPITRERMSGFLFPRLGYQRSSGFILSLPYYLNLHPQFDATIIPSIVSRRGLQLTGETRYLTSNSDGIMKGEVLPDDDIYKDDRYALSYRHRQLFSNKLRLDVDIEKYSDTDYRSDFADNIDSRASVFSRQKVSFSSNNQLIRFRARAVGHERTSNHFRDDDQPYDLFPEFQLQLQNRKMSIFEIGAKTELTRYRHAVDRVDGSRLRFIPQLSIPIRAVYGYIEPKVTLHSIRYDLRDGNSDNDRLKENIPVWSIDSKLFFERSISLNRNSYMQTLEPRLFYLSVPIRETQDKFPKFDTGLGNANSLSYYFRENRFFGGDRVGDTRQLTVGLTSRVIRQDTGREVGKVSVGQVYYFEDRQIIADAKSTSKEKRESSDLLFEFNGTLSQKWKVNGVTNWSDESDQFTYVSLLSRYEGNSKTWSEAGYIQDSDEREYIKLDHNKKFANNWLYGLRTHYSILDDRFRFTELSSTYLNCCWSLGLNFQRYQNDGKMDNRVMISFRLKGLGGN